MEVGPRGGIPYFRVMVPVARSPVVAFSEMVMRFGEVSEVLDTDTSVLPISSVFKWDVRTLPVADHVPEETDTTLPFHFITPSTFPSFRKRVVPTR